MIFTRCILLMFVIASAVIFVATPRMGLAEEGNSPVFIGFSNGSLIEYYPDLEMINLVPSCAVNAVGDLYLADQKTSLVQWIVDTRNEQRSYLRKSAAEFAVGQRAPFFGVSNISNNLVPKGDHVTILETCGDLVAYYSKEKKPEKQTEKPAGNGKTK